MTGFAGVSLRNIELTLLQGSKQLSKDFVNSITMSEIDALAEVFSVAHSSYIDQLNHIAADVRNPVIMLATAKSASPNHSLSFHETISVLDALTKLEASKTLTPAQTEECATTLISGYSAKQGLNLLTQMNEVYKPGSIILSSPCVDEALSAHFLKCAKKPMEWSDFLKICDWIPKISLSGLIKTIAVHFKALDGIEEIKHLFAASYSGSGFGDSQLAAFEEALGAEILVSLTQEQMKKSDRYWPLSCVKSRFGEDSLYSEGFMETVTQALHKSLPEVPEFLKTLCSRQADLDDWPLTANLMIDNYTQVFGYKGCVKHEYLDDFAIKNGMQTKLVSKKIEALRMEFVSLDDWNFEEMKAKSPAEIFSMGASESQGNKKRELRYKELLAACKGIDLVDAKNLLGGISGDVVLAIRDVSGGLSNEKEVLRHYPQAKARFLEHDLGM